MPSSQAQAQTPGTVFSRGFPGSPGRSGRRRAADRLGRVPQVQRDADQGAQRGGPQALGALGGQHQQAARGLLDDRDGEGELVAVGPAERAPRRGGTVDGLVHRLLEVLCGLPAHGSGQGDGAMECRTGHTPIAPPRPGCPIGVSGAFHRVGGQPAPTAALRRGPAPDLAWT